MKQPNKSMAELVYNFFKRALWGKGSNRQLNTKGLCFCIQGAAAAVVPNGYLYEEGNDLSQQGKLARNQLAAELGFVRVADMVHWNDNCATVEQVKARLRQAIRKQGTA
jgi:hypothetical protein